MKYSLFALLAGVLVLAGCGTTTPSDVDESTVDTGVVVEDTIDTTDEIMTGDVDQDLEATAIDQDEDLELTIEENAALTGDSDTDVTSAE